MMDIIVARIIIITLFCVRFFLENEVSVIGCQFPGTVSHKDVYYYYYYYYYYLCPPHPMQAMQTGGMFRVTALYSITVVSYSAAC